MRESLYSREKQDAWFPWHWPTPAEQFMIGSAKVETKDPGSSALLDPGGYAMMAGKHIHQFTCTSACVAFVSSDGAFDIHYLDGYGKEIAPRRGTGEEEIAAWTPPAGERERIAMACRSHKKALPVPRAGEEPPITRAARSRARFRPDP